MYWEFDKRNAPKAAPGATRKNYGSTWWGKQWLQALTDIDYSNRLPRGKTYANKGLAHDLELTGNTITAKVDGSQPKPYKVNITVPVFDHAVQERLLKIVTENPLFLSRLLNRELPPELNEACIKNGIHIFPRNWNDMNGSCSCPDYAVPCKHMAAVLYLIANEIDKNPFVVFDLHGFDLVAALQDSGYSGDNNTSVAVSRLASLQQTPATDTGSFLWDTEKLAALDLSVIPDCRENLLQLLSEKPVFFPEGDFKKTIASAFKNVSGGVTALSKTTATPQEEDFPILQKTEKTLVMLDAADRSFISCSLFDTRDESIVDFSSASDLAAFLERLPQVQTALSAPELRSLHLVYQTSKILAQKGAFVPQILQNNQGACTIRYIPALLNAEVKTVCDQLSNLVAPGMVAYISDTDTYEPVTGDYTPTLLSIFLGHFVQQFTEKQTLEGVIPRWFFSGTTVIFDRFENKEYPQSVHLWLSRFFIAEKDIVPVFEVDEQDGNFEVRVSIEDKTAAMLAPVPLENIFADKKYAAMRIDALRDLSMVADFFPPLNTLIASKGTEQLHFDSQTFVAVFFKTLPVIRLFGIRVLLPKALQKLLRPAVSLALSAGNKGKVTSSGLMSFANMIDFQWQIALGDQLLSPEDFLKLVRQLNGIVRLADSYAFVDAKEIAALLEKINTSPAPAGPKLLQIAIAGEYQGVPVHLDASARALITDLMRPDAVPLPIGLRANLRPYQLRGYEWLYKNTRLGLGSLIADDMGLGKTLQVIATLQRLKEDGALSGRQKAIVVVPTTLLTNWTKEMTRFAPELRAHVYHGTGRSLQPLADADVLLTTYGVVRSEIATLQKTDWLITIIDEAQNIKNLETAQTKAINKLKSALRIAMTGTPVENRLSEYYSLFEFANHGYLGSLKDFTAEYAKPIEAARDHNAADRFRRVTAPFLLRRVKTDKSIINDLPDKIETEQFCVLTPEQAALYQNVVDESLAAITAEKEGNIKRQGLVLKMLTALKQVCNHPAHFLKKPTADPALSGKTQLLLDLLSQILDNGEKTLIFTQYKEMGDLLVSLLREKLGIDAAFLHGGCSRTARDQMVDHFQQNHTAKVLILSLKAGGTGLNLTVASNVIHFDLWWNPAVEAQATDRAFRIGQQRNVQVHRFITQGTFEEKINAMLQSKKELANLTVNAGEKWVGDLSATELRELVRLV